MKFDPSLSKDQTHNAERLTPFLLCLALLACFATPFAIEGFGYLLFGLPLFIALILIGEILGRFNKGLTADCLCLSWVFYVTPVFCLLPLLIALRIDMYPVHDLLRLDRAILWGLHVSLHPSFAEGSGEWDHVSPPFSRLEWAMLACLTIPFSVLAVRRLWRSWNGFKAEIVKPPNSV
jgi:hypothetical protein